MSTKSMTIRSLLEEQLKRRSHLTSTPMTLDDIFIHAKVSQWIMEIIGKDSAEKLEYRIQKTSEARLNHTASTYLLGMAMRDNLNIRFELLPRLISGGTGDAFHFFWAMICLCHDLGYEFETKNRTSAELNRDLNLMKSSSGRKSLFDIEHDLFEVNEPTLKELEIEPTSDTGLWILNAIELAKRYDSLRRQERHVGDKSPILDHGICGALILYDILYKEYMALIARREYACDQRVLRHAETTNVSGMLEGVTKDASVIRFISCCLVIACTVARHNMWLAEDDETKQIYKLYDLCDLWATPTAKVSAATSLDQMLFLLDFMDTIDPVKGLYTRDIEKGSCSLRELMVKKEFLLDHLMIEFEGTCCQDYRWSSSLIYQKFSFFVIKDTDNLFNGFASSITSINKWLHTKAPLRSPKKITFYLPSYPGKSNHWMAGITDHEVNSLLLYLGSGVPGKYDRFYTCPDAYKTFNLLMMPGVEGEQIRVCIENQKPNSMYIREWKRTLDTIIDIFTAQCKYTVYRNVLGKPVPGPLYRADRSINFELMQETNATIALTSTAIGGYQKTFLQNKLNPHVLIIQLGQKVPYFDYEGFFQDQYVFSDEREVLLPPYIHMLAEKTYVDTVEGIGEVTHCEINLDKFHTKIIAEDEEELIDELDRYCEDAAQGFKKFVESKDLSVIPENHPYRKWKEKFQTLCRLCMQNVYISYFGSNI